MTAPRLSFAPREDPYVVEHGGFYRRWLNMIGDLFELEEAVARVTGTTDDVWVPLWTEMGQRHEEAGDRLEAEGDLAGARRAFQHARAYYSIGRFPGAITPLKESASDACNRAFLKEIAHVDPPVEVVEVECEGQGIVSHYWRPASATAGAPVAAVLVMCGADMFKEDRGWAAADAVRNGMGALVMDAPGTGQNPFPYEPEWVKAWVAAVDWLAARPENDPTRIGAFGISRGGYSVLQLAGTYPSMVQAAVAIAGHPFGYVMSPEEMDEFVEMKNKRSTFVFGSPGAPPTFPPTTVEEEEAHFRKWALSELGLVDEIVCPILMINGKKDHLAPIGNIYYMLEHGPVLGREARVYADDGHCAFKYRQEWGPASFKWLAAKLA